MVGVLFNCLTVVVGSIVGMTFSNLIPKRVTNAIMTGIGLCTLYIGISGALKGENTLVLIFSVAIGTVIGTLLDIDRGINNLAEIATKRFKNKNSSVSTAEGFVTASLLFCVGSMTIVGSINAGVSGDNTLLFTKSVLDLFSSMALASTFGVGVLLSTLFVFAFQGGLVLLAQYIAPLLTTSLQNEMVCAGSVIIIGLGLNIIGVTKLKVANYIPAIIIAPLITPLLNMII